MSSRIFKYLLLVVRTLLGATFLFSGFVKAIDPKGTGYKIADYMQAMNLEMPQWLDIPLIAAVILICVEFIIGVYLFLGLRRRFTAIVTSFVMCLFTIVSIFIVIYHPVGDCGCFGDYMVLTDTQTLLKNIVLLALAALLLYKPREIPTLVPLGWHWLISLYSILYIVVFCIVSTYFLPMIDFRPYSIGTDLRKQVFDPQPDANGKVEVSDFFVTDSLGEDYTAKILEEKAPVFLAISPSLKEANFSVTEDFNRLNDWCLDKGYHFYCITASTAKDIDEWVYYNDAQYPFLVADNTMLKTMIRSNPGLVLLHDGVVGNKWSVHDMPNIETVDRLGVSGLEKAAKSSTKAMFDITFWYIVPLLVLIVLSNILHGICCLIWPKKFRKNTNKLNSNKNIQENEKENRSRQLENEHDPAGGRSSR